MVFLYVHFFHNVNTRKAEKVAGTLASITLDTQLADEAAKVLGVKTPHRGYSPGPSRGDRAEAMQEPDEEKCG